MHRRSWGLELIVAEHGGPARRGAGPRAGEAQLALGGAAEGVLVAGAGLRACVQHASTLCNVTQL